MNYNLDIFVVPLVHFCELTSCISVESYFTISLSHLEFFSLTYHLCFDVRHCHLAEPFCVFF